MSNSVYASLTRQSGLMKEMQSIAHNIANSGTVGFRADQLLFAEHVKATGEGQPSISFAVAGAHGMSLAQGSLSQTGSRLDLAIEGEGYFQLETPAGLRISRAGSFFRSPDGEMVTADGMRLLDAGGAPVFIPADAGNIAISSDGTVSVSGDPLAQIGLVKPVDAATLIRENGVCFEVKGDTEAVLEPKLMQGFLENSNVDPVGQIARMIQVQRAYEMGQGFLEKEAERMHSIMSLITR